MSSVQNKDKILRKIKRCLALSKSQNANEAASALRQAHALMAKHSLSASEVAIDQYRSNTQIAARPPAHIVALANTIAPLFACQITLVWGAKNYVFQFIGVDHYPQIAGYAFDVLARQLASARKTYMGTELKRVRIKANKTARADQYCQAWVYAVARNLSDLQPPDIDTTPVDEYMDRISGDPQEARDRTRSAIARKHESQDARAGFQDGKKVKVLAGMDGENQLKLTQAV